MQVAADTNLNRNQSLPAIYYLVSNLAYKKVRVAMFVRQLAITHTCMYTLHKIMIVWKKIVRPQQAFLTIIIKKNRLRFT